MNILGYSLLNPILTGLFGIVSLSLCYLGFKGIVWLMQELYHYDYISLLKSKKKDHDKINSFKYRKIIFDL